MDQAVVQVLQVQMEVQVRQEPLVMTALQAQAERQVKMAAVVLLVPMVHTALLGLMAHRGQVVRLVQMEVTVLLGQVG